MVRTVILLRYPAVLHFAIHGPFDTNIRDADEIPKSPPAHKIPDTHTEILGDRPLSCTLRESSLERDPYANVRAGPTKPLIGPLPSKNDFNGP